jgi:anionic cell wall polymer biosynthesis LytR-Cps2A-Psr (LCP) family protein
MGFRSRQPAATNISSAPSPIPPTPTPTPTPDPLAPLNILLLGYAGPNHDGGNLTDTLILAHLDPKTKQATLISIPRDLWVSLPITSTSTQSSKINAAWAIGNDDRRYPQKPSVYTGDQGGINLAKYAAAQITGINPNYVVAVNFQGFEDIISLLGNITVYVPYTFDDNFYPLTGEEQNTCGKSPEEIQALAATISGEKLEREFLCRYEQLHFIQGSQTMDAATALKFARSRHSEVGGGDFGRSTRQQAVLTGIKDKLFSFSSLTKLIPIIETILRNVRTDIGLELIKNFLTIYPNPKDFNITTLTLNQKELIIPSVSSDRQYILIPVLGENNYTAIHQFIQDTLAGKPAILIKPSPQSTPSATLTP